MHDIRLTPRAERDLESLSPEIQERICKKLRDNARLENPLVRAKPLVNLPPSTHRFRVGKYRVSFYVASQTIFVERIEIRSEAY